MDDALPENEPTAGLNDVRGPRKGRPSKLDIGLVQRALEQARAENRARGMRGEPSDIAVHRLCTAPGDTAPIGSRPVLKSLLAEIRSREAGSLPHEPEATTGEGEPQPTLDLAGKIETLNPSLRQLLEALVDGAVSLSGSASTADARARHLEQEAAGLRHQLALVGETAAREAEDAANALREAQVRTEESEGAYFEVQEQLAKASEDRRRIGDLLGRMRDRWLTTTGRASLAERQVREVREESERQIREERQASEGKVAEANRLAGELAERARHADEAAQEAATKAEGLGRQLQVAAEAGNVLRDQAAQLQAALREARNEVRISQEQASALQGERDRLLSERDTAVSATRSAELAAGVMRAELDAATRARDKAEERADRLDAERQTSRPAKTG